MTAWPTWEAVEEYRIRGSPIGIRGEITSHSYSREVQFEQVCRLFTDEAWEEDVQKYGGLRLF
jgi:hypothetical protein